MSNAISCYWHQYNGWSARSEICKLLDGSSIFVGMCVNNFFALLKHISRMKGQPTLASEVKSIMLTERSVKYAGKQSRVTILYGRTCAAASSACPAMQIFLAKRA